MKDRHHSSFGASSPGSLLQAEPTNRQARITDSLNFYGLLVGTIAIQPSNWRAFLAATAHDSGTLHCAVEPLGRSTVAAVGGVGLDRGDLFRRPVVYFNRFNHRTASSIERLDEHWGLGHRVVDHRAVESLMWPQKGSQPDHDRMIMRNAIIFRNGSRAVLCSTGTGRGERDRSTVLGWHTGFAEPTSCVSRWRIVLVMG